MEIPALYDLMNYLISCSFAYINIDYYVYASINIKLGQADEFLVSKVDLDCGAL